MIFIRKSLCLIIVFYTGIGDAIAVLLATALADLPKIDTLNLRDNNLTDIGMTGVCGIDQHYIKKTQFVLSYNQLYDNL